MFTFIKLTMKIKKLTRKLIILKKMARSYFGYKVGSYRPFVCVYCTTISCNLSCPYCPISQDFEKLINDNHISGELKTADSKKIIEDISSLGVSVFVFSGGEPLLRKDIFELAAFAQEKNMSTILYTNGTLIDNENIPLIKKYFDSVIVSFPEIINYSKFRSQESIIMVEKNIKRLKEEGVETGVSFVINKFSIDYIEEITALTKNIAKFILYIPVHYAKDYKLREDQKTNLRERLLSLKDKHSYFISNSKEYLSDIADFLVGKKPDNKCNAFRLYLFLTPDALLQGCSYPISVGDLKTETAKSLLQKGITKREEISQRCDKGVLEGCGQVSILFNQSIFKSFLSSLNLLKKIIK